jgi:hypothetical protein
MLQRYRRDKNQAYLYHAADSTLGSKRSVEWEGLAPDTLWVRILGLQPSENSTLHPTTNMSKRFPERDSV